jgi:outer membrane protein, heavy metal efflux system
MKNKIIIKLLTLAFCFNANAQSNIENILTEVSKNNKTIIAEKQYWETQKIQFKTDITPSDPMVGYNYMVGRPADAGNQQDFTIIQTIDFPTTYVKKAQLAKELATQSDIHLSATRQDILFEAKKICLDLVYENKLHTQLNRQNENIEKLLSDFQKKLDKGDGNMLDVNKAKLQLIEIKKQVQQNTSNINQLQQKLTALNGGTPISFTDTVYPLIPELPNFEQIEEAYEIADPIRKSLEQEKIITEKQIEISKSMWLPKLEAGYHYQGILGQTYNGVHTGISIPLWENKNKVKLQKSKLLYDELSLQEHRNSHYFEIKQNFEKYIILESILGDYNKVFESINSTQLLNKALELGQISTIEYFLEMNYFNTALRNLLETENEMHVTLAALLKYQL